MTICQQRPQIEVPRVVVVHMFWLYTEHIFMDFALGFFNQLDFYESLFFT